MNIRELNQLDALKRAYVYLTSTPLPPPLQSNPPQGLTDQVNTIKTIIDQVDSVVQDQTSGNAQKATDQRRALRNNLIKSHLTPIFHIATVLSKDDPGMPKLVNIRNVRSEQRLINIAQAAIRDLLPYKDKFIAKGLPADFLDQLQTAITALQQAADVHRDTSVKRVKARAGIIETLAKASAPKRVLTAIFRRDAITDPDGAAFLRGWEAASHVKRGRRKTEDATGTTGTTATSAGSATTSSSAVLPTAKPAALAPASVTASAPAAA